MIPVVTPEEMRAIDAAAPEPVEVLVRRAGAAVARAAVGMLGGTYGRRVTVVAGKGNNGADGRDAARRLARRGVRAQVVEATDAPERVIGSDLVIDAAYGTGFRGEYDAPDTGGTPVLSVDIPSGVDGNTGQAGPGAARARATVSFAALKPGLLFADGYERSGQVEVVDIGMDVSAATIGLVQHDDVAAWAPPRSRDAHKWQTALWVVAGSPGMAGAARLSAEGAMRAGAGMVRLGTPGVDVPESAVEVVGRALPAQDWDDVVVADAEKVKAAIVGPGLGRDASTAGFVRRLLGRLAVPTVVDADGIIALGDMRGAAEVLRRREAATVLTPHDGEFALLAGERPGDDRIAAARRLARETGAVVLLKGSTTVVAEPGGRVLLAAAGDARLATAGTGDVLSGVLGAFLAQGLEPLCAAAAAAYVHGAAAHLGPTRGLVARDLLVHVPTVLSTLW